ncbi:Uncharacterised protein [Candidatus Bilamarchaeum dharawalense]|uniref:DUF1931 domain-containing protein n=1 Tax=Candidatus Bilamarchaeum dharawalense TaxID=2885759 RepID=A0A5E4LTC7_9ARCH|nr:Uncharacterised protein [Candidatus Bilamarchaeum dharawalense]
MKSNLIVSKNRVRIFLQQNGKRTSLDFYDALDAEVRALLKKAAKRANENNRATAMPIDL